MRQKSFLTLVLIVTLFSLTSCFKMTRPGTDDTPEPAVTVIYVNVTEEPSPESNTGVRPTRVKATLYRQRQFQHLSPRKDLSPITLRNLIKFQITGPTKFLQVMKIRLISL